MIVCSQVGCGRQATDEWWCDAHRPKKPLLGPAPNWCQHCSKLLNCPHCRADYDERNRVHMSEKTTPVPDELLREITVVMKREMNRLVGGGSLRLEDQVPGDLRQLIHKLPSPPPLDPVEECAKAFRAAAYADTQVIATCEQAGVKAALQRYRELGCPELK